MCRARERSTPTLRPLTAWHSQDRFPVKLFARLPRGSVDSGCSELRSQRRLVFALLCVLLLRSLAVAVGTGFAPARRVGFTVGDQWEPALAADGFGHVYILHPQYVKVPGCPSCPVPSMVFMVSNDNGSSWQAPRQIVPPASAQFDAQIVVDPADRRTVYAAWLENGKHDIVVAKSVDFGESWSLVIGVRSLAEMDKPVLAVRGRDVYVGYSQARELRVIASHDGGITFASSVVSPERKLGWSLAGGGTVDPAGNVYFAWAGYVRLGEGPVFLYVSRSGDGGGSWSNTLVDISAAAPDCLAEECGWAFLGAQITIASDAAGTLYALWNAGAGVRGGEKIYFASSTTAGVTWSPKLAVSTVAVGGEHAFPSLVAGAAGDVRIAWMDQRRRPLWNTYYRSSTNGGATWSGEAKLSHYAPGYSYIHPEGFRFPFGDYFGLGIDSRGQTQAVWGEGLNYSSPGSIWYSSGR